MIIKDWKKEILTIPNLLSIFRIALIPVYLHIYLNADSPGDYTTAAVILAVSCLTDMVDGKIARKFNMITNLGKVLDPIADKLTQFTLIICLSIRYPSLQVVVIFFFLKELFQCVAGLFFMHKGKMLPGALMAGKVCTTVLFISLILLVLLPDMNDTLVDLIAVIDLGFLTVSFISYIFAYIGKYAKLEDMPE